MVRKSLALAGISTAALLVAASPALAQSAGSNVSLYGILDANIGYGKGSISSAKQIGTGGFAGNRIGVRGTEDLGGGLRAMFTLEHGFNGDTGTAASGSVFWNRQVWVGVSAPWGDFLLGRQYTPTFQVHAAYDIFGPQGVAAQQALLGSMEFLSNRALSPAIRADAAALYRTPAGLGGFAMQAMVNDRRAAVGGYRGVRVGYAGGGLAADIAVARFQNDPVDDVKAITAGIRYTMAPFKFTALYDRANTGLSSDSRGYGIGASYTMGSTEFKVSMGQSNLESAAGVDIGKTTRYGVGFVHTLSKRTLVYGQVAELRNRDGAAMSVNGAATAPNHNARGFDLGVMHSF